MGLKYVNNDACYPSLIVVGQIMDALLSGKYDLISTAVIITQTGGGCRASNYIGFIRRALEESRICSIFRLSPLNLSGLEDNPGFKTYSCTASPRNLCSCIRRYLYEMCLPYASL